MNFTLFIYTFIYFFIITLQLIHAIKNKQININFPIGKRLLKTKRKIMVVFNEDNKFVLKI
jgi:hypothetical protein